MHISYAPIAPEQLVYKHFHAYVFEFLRSYIWVLPDADAPVLML